MENITDILKHPTKKWHKGEKKLEYSTWTEDKRHQCNVLKKLKKKFLLRFPSSKAMYMSK
jgi:hypothetical protein